MKIENVCELEDFIDGCALFGVGGGGNPEEGFRALKSALDEKGAIRWIDVERIDDNACAVCTFLMGSSAPMTPERAKRRDEAGLTEVKCPINLMNAILEWENYTGKKADVVVPIEVGGSNMPVPIAVAKKLDKTIVDGDFAGRAIPEIFQTTLSLEDVPFCPGTSVDKFGNVTIIKEVINVKLAERIGKHLSRVAFGSTGMAGFAVTGKQLKRLLVRGTVSRAFHLGKLLRSARDGKMPLCAAMEKKGGRFFFKGRVVDKKVSEEDNYYVGFTTIKGDKGGSARIFFKNENHILWKNDNCIASSPDIISCINPETVKPVRNGDIGEGMPMEIYAFPCNPVLKEKKIFQTLCPRYFGFDLNYIPID